MGSTLFGLAHRHKGHLKSAAQSGDKSKFHRALAEWQNDEYWDVVVDSRFDELHEEIALLRMEIGTLLDLLQA